jgi:hypothetical protein
LWDVDREESRVRLRSFVVEGCTESSPFHGDSAMKTVYHLTFLLGVGGAALAFALVERRRHDAQLAELREEIRKTSATSDRDVARYEVSLAGLLAPLGSATASAAAAPTSSAPSPSGQDAGSKAPEKVHPAPEPSAMRDHYDISFLGDHADSNWTAREAREATSKLTSALPEGSSLRSFECRTSMCRIEVSHKDFKHATEFNETAFRDPSTRIWNTAGFSAPLRDEPSTDGSIVNVVFVAREGKGLPEFEPD